MIFKFLKWFLTIGCFLFISFLIFILVVLTGLDKEGSRFYFSGTIIESYLRNCDKSEISLKSGNTKFFVYQNLFQENGSYTLIIKNDQNEVLEKKQVDFSVMTHSFEPDGPCYGTLEAIKITIPFNPKAKLVQLVEGENVLVESPIVDNLESPTILDLKSIFSTEL